MHGACIALNVQERNIKVIQYNYSSCAKQKASKDLSQVRKVQFGQERIPYKGFPWLAYRRQENHHTYESATLQVQMRWLRLRPTGEHPICWSYWIWSDGIPNRSAMQGPPLQSDKWHRFYRIKYFILLSGKTFSNKIN